MREAAPKRPVRLLRASPEHSRHAEGFSAAPRVCASSRMPQSDRSVLLIRSEFESVNLTQFNALGLNAALLKALESQGYEIPTPIQSAAIPELLKGSDLLGIAQTGTGKTAALPLPFLDLWAKLKARPDRGTCRALILSPTRELAAQI